MRYDKRKKESSKGRVSRRSKLVEAAMAFMFSTSRFI